MSQDTPIMLRRKSAAKPPKPAEAPDRLPALKPFDNTSLPAPNDTQRAILAIESALGDRISVRTGAEIITALLLAAVSANSAKAKSAQQYITESAAECAAAAIRELRNRKAAQ